MISVKHYKGFAVLTSTILLSVASMVFSVRMASIQLIDNKIVGNYYRNNEAFVNAESGIHLLLSKIDDLTTGTVLLASLPATPGISVSYNSVANHYSVQITRLNRNTLEISSLGHSMDGSAQRRISVQIYHEMRFNLPNSALSINGKVNLDDSATVNNGCEGVSAADCKSPGNIADYQLLSHPDNETARPADRCNGSSEPVKGRGDNKTNASPGVDNTGVNVIADNVFYEPLSEANTLQISDFNNAGEAITWPNNIPADSHFYGDTVATDLQPSSLFESTFGVTKEAGIPALKSSSAVAKIDMSNPSLETSCSQRLQYIAQYRSEIETIHIKGDCDIDQSDATRSVTSENKRFTIGTVDSPKMIFIEGGTFTTNPNTGTSVVGMLYFLPGIKADGTENEIVDMGGIRVNGAILSGYSCSHDGYDKSDKKGSKQHFYARYDKAVLNKLYQDMGQQPAIDTGYSIVSGSWRDF